MLDVKLEKNMLVGTLYILARIQISNNTARTGWYVLVRQQTSTWTTYY